MGKDLKDKELGKGISQRADGRYMARYKNKCKYADTEKEIRRVYRQLVTDIENNTYIETNSITLNEYFKQWLESRFDVKGSTKATYKTIYERVKPILGNKKVQKITKLDIKKLQSELVEENKATVTINSTIMLLFSVFKSAKDDGIILVNPCEGVKSLKACNQCQAVETIHRALTVEEQKIFMDEVKEGESWYYNMIDFMLCTGVRMGEARALQWKDIDYKNNVIHIKNNMSKDENNKQVKSTPKTKTSIRDIPLTDNIKSILNRQRDQYNMFFGNVQNINAVVFFLLKRIAIFLYLFISPRIADISLFYKVCRLFPFLHSTAELGLHYAYLRSQSLYISL